MPIIHSKQFANKQNPINGIENFWNQATSGWALHRANLIAVGRSTEPIYNSGWA